jgi:hypothetical protein
MGGSGASRAGDVALFLLSVLFLVVNMLMSSS